MIFQRMAILGVGLIGGSLALAARSTGVCGEIVGWGRSEKTLRRALELGVIDRAETELVKAVSKADLVVAAVPPGSMLPLFQSLLGYLAPGAILTDVGSTKGSIEEDARAVFGNSLSFFVPGHPIAGTERSGVEAADVRLFQGRRVILTPLAETKTSATTKVRDLWVACGAEVIEMPVDYHDAVLAATSHLPHVLAFALVDTLARGGTDVFKYAAGGFRDFTRIAGSDPVMWRDICVANRVHLLRALDQYRSTLDQLAIAIDAQDGEYLHQVFLRARTARERS